METIKTRTVKITNGRPNGFVTAEEFAKKCGVSKNTIRVWILRGKLSSALKIGREWWIMESDERPKRKKKERKTVKPLNKDKYFVDDISKIFNVNQETIRRWIRSGKLKASLPYKYRGYIVEYEDLEDFALNRARKGIRDIWTNNKGL